MRAGDLPAKLGLWGLTRTGSSRTPMCAALPLTGTLFTEAVCPTSLRSGDNQGRAFSEEEGLGIEAVLGQRLIPQGDDVALGTPARGRCALVFLPRRAFFE